MSKFTIRIKPKEGECLTSFLYRLANENECKMPNLIEKIKMPGKRRGSKYTIPTLVFSPLDNYNMSKLSSFTGLAEKQLLGHTIHPYHLKFTHAINLLNREWETQYRRFCPCCLEEKNYFKLIWQVKELEICLVHKVKLRHFCHKCNYLLPFADSITVLNKQCPKCEAFLTTGIKTENKSTTYLKDQQRKYEDWIYLLSKDIDSGIYHSLDEYLTLTYLYFISTQENIKDIPIPRFRGFYNTLINSIKTKKKNKDRSVTPLNLLRTLRHYDVRVQNFFQLKVPENFLNSSIVEAQGKLGKCLAPWCTCFGKSTSMKRAKLHRSSLRFSDISICTRCNVAYGFERNTKEWKNIDGLIKIFEDLNGNLEVDLDINKLLKNKGEVSEFQGNYLLGYLWNYYNSTININMYISKEKQEQLKDLVSKTKNIPHLKSMAIKKYGWDTLEFFCIYHSNEVKSHIYFGLKETRTQKTIDNRTGKVRKYINYLLENDIEITIDEVCNGIGCSVRTLSESGLNKLIFQMKEKQGEEERILIQKEKYRNIIETYLKECLELGKQPNCREIYSLLGLTHATFKKNHPDVYGFMKKEVDIINSKLHDKMIEGYKRSCKRSIEKIVKSGDRLSYIHILTKAGLGSDYCRRYKKLRVFVDNEISRYKDL